MCFNVLCGGSGESIIGNQWQLHRVELEAIHVDEVKDGLKTRILGQQIVHYDSIGSTNDAAKKLAVGGGAEGTTIISEFQHGGRGRKGRTWLSPRGGLWFSMILKPRTDLAKVSLFSLMTGVAVAKAVHRVTGLKVWLKWPNDVTVNNRKICGILSELVEGELGHSVVVGVGVNVNIDVQDLPENVRKEATSLRKELGKDVNRENLLCKILEETEKMYTPYLKEPEGYKLILLEWRRLTNTLKTRVKVHVDGEVVEGYASDVDEQGALLVKTENGSIRRFLAGDVSLIRTSKLGLSRQETSM